MVFGTVDFLKFHFLTMCSVDELEAPENVCTMQGRLRGRTVHVAKRESSATAPSAEAAAERRI